MSDEQFSAFRELVFNDRDLQTELSSTEDSQVFTNLVIEAANERGIQVTENDVLNAVNFGRRGWIEQWIR